ncbi:MAG TPA: hypothetical protein DD706_15700 [Nitrospiraceae bacterium]|nr:hypothetical protein [Nitrospiraceae bacterium]
MSEEQKSKKQSWWQTLPGVLTAVATVITAMTGLIVGLQQAGYFSNTVDPDPPPIEDSDSRNGGPVAQGFRVVESNLRADPFDYRGPCPVLITFTGRVSVAGGGGVVSYKFLRNDGASAPVHSLTFDGPGSQPVETTWRLGGSAMTYSGWQAIQIVDPQDRESNKATFKITCQ